MPIYEYDCQQCGARSEILLRSSDPAPTCRQCNSSDLTKRISAHAVSSGAPDTPCGNAPCSPSPACGGGGCPSSM